jgi:hypothetical protein
MEYKTYDSLNQTEHLKLVAPYYNAIVPTTVCFEREKVSACVDALGHIEIFDDKKNSLASVDVPVSKDPSEYGHSAQYGTVECAAEGGVITFFLPVYGWHDHYPNCDGESDRWSRYTDRWFRVVFDCGKGTLTVLDR